MLRRNNQGNGEKKNADGEEQVKEMLGVMTESYATMWGVGAS